MQTLIDFDDAPVFGLPVLDPAGGPAVAEGMLIEGPQGWGEFSPPPDADDAALARWLTAATEPGTIGWPDPVRGRIPVAVTVPAVDAARARQIVQAAGCHTADVAVGDPSGTLADDVARVAAVRDGLGSAGLIRCDAGGRWDPDYAVHAIAALERAAGVIEFVAVPCPSLAQVAWVKARVAVPIAAAAGDPREVRELAGAADIAVLRCGRLGGARRALRVAELSGLPCVVVSDAVTSIGVAAGLALAGALPELPYASSLGTRLLFGGDIVVGPRSSIPVDGTLAVAPMPPAPAAELLDRYTMPDPARIQWWRRRLRAAIAE